MLSNPPNLAVQTNMWGGAGATASGVTSIHDLYYLSLGSDEQSVREAAAVGYDGVEIFDGNLFRYRSNPEELLNLFSAASVQLVAVYSGASFIYCDALEDELARLRVAAKLGQQFGARFHVLGGGAVRASGARDEDYGSLARGLDAVDAQSRQFGLQAVYHPHLGTLSETPDALDRIMRLTDIALCPDLGHLLAGGGDPVEIVREHRDRIPYVHLKDYAQGEFRAIGDGEVDFEGVVAELAGAHAPDWWTIELGDADIPLKAAKIGYQRAAALLSST